MARGLRPSDNSRQELIEVEIKIHQETHKAYLVSTETVKKVWIPKVISGEEYDVDEDIGGKAIITVPEWWAASKELI